VHSQFPSADQPSSAHPLTDVIDLTESIGIVAIGRNEGERLKRCLYSVAGYPLVYVDSGSTDGSAEFAASQGAQVVKLDMAQPFTAARARNAGFQALMEHHPELLWVMFVDGDCEIQPQWLHAAHEFIQSQPSIAVVCGRRREKFPQATVFNELCDMEWNTSVGTAKACGGDALYKVDVFKQVNGFDDQFIAGEEPELCFRIRELGYSIQRIPQEMTLHDANITRVVQWWKRNERSGHAYLLGYLKHGQKNDEQFNFRDIKSILIWVGLYGFLILLALITASWKPLLLLMIAIYLQATKMSLSMARRKPEYDAQQRLIYAIFVMLGKVPQALGIVKAYINHRQGRAHTLIEYK
jgi:GT2 family glycosyltransferase